jgi:hypothetical protein
MSQWGVFRDDEGVRHVAPVLEDGRLPVHHSLHEFCPCGPKQDPDSTVAIWVHQDRERGGYAS